VVPESQNVLAFLESDPFEDDVLPPRGGDAAKRGKICNF
jgi:hypothetical protein